MRRGEDGQLLSLQQLAFLSYLMNGDTIALLPLQHQAGAPYDLRVRLVEEDRE